MLMKTRQVLCLIFAVLLAVGWQAPAGAQDIPANYVQNPNMAHDLNAIFWYGGWDYVTFSSNAIASMPWMYMTDEDSHSGNWSMNLIHGWVWVSYPVRGQEEKKMKASFWYKGHFETYWNFIYRDVGMTFEDLHPNLAEYVGADTAYFGGDGQPAMAFDFGGEDHFTEDWTYFEFVWDMPGTIKGWGNTTMWWTEFEPAYVDDFYYGEWYDGHYAGEEPFDFINGDFEGTDLNIEWTLNVWYDDVPGRDSYVSVFENNTEAGAQSLRLQNYLDVSIDTIDEAPPIQADSIIVDTSEVNRNVTYYLPALGAEDKDMEMSFWYKGNDATLSMEFYDDYDVTVDEFPLPEGAMLKKDSVWVVDTMHVAVIDTVKTATRPKFTVDYDTYTVDPVDAEWVDAWYQDFEDPSNNVEPFSDGFWSDAGFYEGGWETVFSGGEEAYTGWNSLWLPGDNGWTGPYGESPPIVVDNTTQRITFMYRGKLYLWLNFGDYTKYDLVADPDGIVPPEASVDGGTLEWALDKDEWTEFSFEWDQGSWQADSLLADTVPLYFTIGSGYVPGENGFIDDMRYQRWTVVDPARNDTTYAVTSEIVTDYLIDETIRIDTLGEYWDVWDFAAVWDLPVAADWTEWDLAWTNPGGDIGGTLTLMLESEMVETPDIIVPLEKEDFDDEHAGWTYFDDFVYGEAEPEGIDRNLVQYDLHTYPNPATDVIHLSIQIPLSRVEVYNSVGQLQMDLDHPDRILNIEHLEDGMFFINATDETGVVHKAKFVKR